MRTRRTTILVKLLGSSAILTLLTAVVGILAITKLSAVNDRAAVMYEDGTTPIAALSETRSALSDIDSQALRAILREDEGGNYAGRIAADRARAEAELAKVAARITDPEEIDDLRQIRSRWASYVSAIDRAFTQLERGTESGYASAESVYFAQLAPLYAQIDRLLGELNGDRTQFAQELRGEVASTYESGRNTTLVVMLLAVVLGLALSLWMARGVRAGIATVLDRLETLRTHCVAELRGAIKAMADGDLTRTVTPVTTEIDTWSNDEIGDAARAVNDIREALADTIEAYNQTRGSLTGLVGEVLHASGRLSAASVQMASTSEEAGKAVGEIASAVGDVAAGAERQVRMVESAKLSTDETSLAASDMHRASQEGVSAVQQATAAMEAVRDSSGSVTDVIRSLASKSEQIGGIVQTITGIAGQTNLLALNAAIEAARAGEQGRGFAVVAEEVRKLAEESQAAAASIAALIDQIQAETQRAVEVVEDGSQRTADGAAVVEQARDAFVRIGESVSAVSGKVSEIATAMSEVAAVAEQSSASSEQVSASTEQTSASTQEIAASAQELARTAEELSGLVGRFRLAA